MVETNKAEFLEKFGKNEAYTLALLLDNDFESVFDELERNNLNKNYITKNREMFYGLPPTEVANSLIADAIRGKVKLDINLNHIPFKRESTLFKLAASTGIIDAEATPTGKGFFSDVGSEIGGFFGNVLGGILAPVTQVTTSILAAPTAVTSTATGAAAVNKKNYTPWIIGGVAVAALGIAAYFLFKKR